MVNQDFLRNLIKFKLRKHINEIESCINTLLIFKMLDKFKDSKRLKK